jgi:hypothetical protein
LSSIWPVKKKHQLLGSSDGKLLVGGVASPIYARTIICVSFDAMKVGDYPYDMLLKLPLPPPVLLHLTHAGAILWLMQWPSSCYYEADNKSKFLLFRVSNHGLKYISKLVEAAWGQATFQGEGNVRCISWAASRMGHGPMLAILNWIAHNNSIQVAENRVQKILRRKMNSNH